MFLILILIVVLLLDRRDYNNSVNNENCKKFNIVYLIIGAVFILFIGIRLFYPIWIFSPMMSGMGRFLMGC
ncbi:hypothetical protein [Cetobacterium sp.]